MKLAKDISNYILFMDEGKIVEKGSPDVIFNNTKTDRLKNFWRLSVSVTHERYVMKKLLFSAILLAFIYVPANADTVRMGTEGAYPPYNFINDNGEIDGFERDLGDELCDRAGLDCEGTKRLGLNYSKSSIW